MTLPDTAPHLPAAATASPVQAPRRRHATVGDLGVPAIIYATIVALRLAALRAQLPPGHDSHHGMRAALTSWDGAAFLQIARIGYPHRLVYSDGQLVGGSRAAFFPLYPATVRATHLLTGLSWDRAGIGAAVAASTVAAVLIYRLGVVLHSRTAGVCLLVLVMAQPLSVVFDMAYTEGLFLALAVGTLLALRARRWLTAGGLCFAAGLARPTGLAVAAAVAVAAVVWLWRHPRAGGRWRPVVAVLVGAAGVPAWWLYVGVRLHRLDAWFRIQDDAWHTRFDGGRATARAVAGLLRHPITWADLGLLLLLAAAVALATVAVSERIWLPLLVYGLVVVALALGADGIVGVKARYLAVAVAGLVPVAVALSKARRPTAVIVLVTYAAVGVWYGTHVLAVGGLTV